MIEQLIAEATECDFKVALETKKPKSWLKSVSRNLLINADSFFQRQIIVVFSAVVKTAPDSMAEIPVCCTEWLNLQCILK